MLVLVNCCEGPKATQSVTVVETPIPVVGKTTVEICQGTTTQSLLVTGTGLKWTDLIGKVTTAAPTPATPYATQNPDGDLFLGRRCVCSYKACPPYLFLELPPRIWVWTYR